MKLFILTAAIMMSFSHFTFADIHDMEKKHSNLCNSLEVKEMMGSTGSCQLIIAEKTTPNKSGVCMGKYMSLICTIKYSMTPEEALIDINCGGINMEVPAEAFSYNIAGLVKMENGKQVFIDDNKNYLGLSSRILSLMIIKEDGMIKEQSMNLTLGVDAVDLTDTICM